MKKQKSKQKSKQIEDSNKKYYDSLNETINEMESGKQSMLEMDSIEQRKGKKRKSQKKKDESNIQVKQAGQLGPVYRKFFKYTLKRWKMALICLFMSMLSGFVNSLFPLKLGQLLDVITKQTNSSQKSETFKEQLQFAMISLGSLTIIIGITTFIRYYLLQNFQQRLGIDLKQEIYSVFIKNDIYFFEINQSSALVSRITNDVNQAKSAISNNLTFLLRNLVSILTSLIVLLIMSWKLTLILIGMIPIYVYVTWAYANKAKSLIKTRQDLEASISQHIGEKFLGINVIKSYGTEDKEIQKYNKFTQDTFVVQKSRILYQAIQNSVSSVLPSFGALLVLVYAGVQVLQDTSQLTAGELTSFVLYCNILSSSTMAVSSTYSSLINGIAAIQKVLEMMEYKRLINENQGEQLVLDGSLEFRNVRFRYPNSPQLMFEDLNFTIDKGQYVAFIGQSGSGKSTITKLILGFYAFQDGKIYFNNSVEGDSQKLDIKNLRSQIGVVNQDATVFSGTIEENITYGLSSYTEEELEEAAKKAGCLEFIQNTQLFPSGFKSEVGQRGNKISGGQRQRIAIARALMRKPQILIFDEATSALDSHSETVVQNSIQELAKNSNLTIIIIAHRLSTVINCNKLYVMKQGSVIEQGTHKNLLKAKGYYYSLIQKQLHESSDEEDNSSVLSK